MIKIKITALINILRHLYLKKTVFEKQTYIVQDYISVALKPFPSMWSYPYVVNITVFPNGLQEMYQERERVQRNSRYKFILGYKRGMHKANYSAPKIHLFLNLKYTYFPPLKLRYGELKYIQTC